jgi:hypothetical protein
MHHGRDDTTTLSTDLLQMLDTVRATEIAVDTNPMTRRAGRIAYHRMQDSSVGVGKSAPTHHSAAEMRPGLTAPVDKIYANDINTVVGDAGQRREPGSSPTGGPPISPPVGPTGLPTPPGTRPPTVGDLLNAIDNGEVVGPPVSNDNDPYDAHRDQTMSGRGAWIRAKIADRAAARAEEVEAAPPPVAESEAEAAARIAQEEALMRKHMTVATKDARYVGEYEMREHMISSVERGDSLTDAIYRFNRGRAWQWSTSDWQDGRGDSFFRDGRAYLGENMTRNHVYVKAYEAAGGRLTPEEYRALGRMNLRAARGNTSLRDAEPTRAPSSLEPGEILEFNRMSPAERMEKVEALKQAHMRFLGIADPQAALNSLPEDRVSRYLGIHTERTNSINPEMFNPSRRPPPLPALPEHLRSTRLPPLPGLPPPVVVPAPSPAPPPPEYEPGSVYRTRAAAQDAAAESHLGRLDRVTNEWAFRTGEQVRGVASRVPTRVIRAAGPVGAAVGAGFMAWDTASTIQHTMEIDQAVQGGRMPQHEGEVAKGRDWGQFAWRNVMPVAPTPIQPFVDVYELATHSDAAGDLGGVIGGAIGDVWHGIFG